MNNSLNTIPMGCTNGLLRSAPAIHPDGIAGAVVDVRRMVEAESPSLPIAETPRMRELLDQARRFARSSATVLLTGPSGTGKELLAHLIHQSSSRAHLPYVRVNCAALPEGLMESELFGHERGAFTGAVVDRLGRLAAAGKGTLLLDEISEIPLRLQAKMLRVLEENEYQRIGSNETLRVSARFIATTNQCLEQAVRAGTFREDLYYRINVLQMELPTLRDRHGDILPLAEKFLDEFRHEGLPPVSAISSRSAKLLLQYDWPGNVRELRNAIHRACVICRTGLIEPEDLLQLTRPKCAPEQDLHEMPLEDAERLLILAMIRRHGGNKTAAAQQLRVSPRTLSNKLKKYRQQGLIAAE